MDHDHDDPKSEAEKVGSTAVDLTLTATAEMDKPETNWPQNEDVSNSGQYTGPSCSGKSKLESTKVWLPKVSLCGSKSQSDVLPTPGSTGSEKDANLKDDVNVHSTSCSNRGSFGILKKDGKSEPPADCSSNIQNLSQEEMVDITNRFLEAVKTLELGELLHDPSFGLFEAMSAIEMMDPKMDAGMICNKGNRVILNFEQAFQSGALRLENLTTEELIGIIDTTTSCLVTWLEGHSLAQTVFTNLYLHKPTVIIDKYLKAGSVAALKLVDVIEECISKAGVFEEEDFQPSVYGYNLATMFTDSKTTSMLRECEEDLQKRIRTSSKSSGGKTELKDDGSCSDSEIEKISALQARFKFTRLFHSLILHIWKRDNLNECAKLLSGCQENLQFMQKTAHLGLQRGTEDSEQFMVGFELLVNQRLLPPTFPRSTRIKTTEEAFSFLDGLLQRIKTVLKVTTIPTFHGIVEFFHSFSETRPCVLSRSLLQLLYGPMRFKKPGIDEMMDSMKESVKTFIAPPVLTSKTLTTQYKEIPECVDMFFERCATVFANLLMACGHNRARQRDKLAHLMDDFANLQNETEKIDSYINSLCLQIEGIRPHQNCFGTWLLCHISKLMIRYVLSGFELELYSLHEFAYIYWYLYEFLYAWLLSAYTRADAYIADVESSTFDKSGKKSNKKNQKASKAKSKAYNKELLILQAEQNLAGGFFQAMMGLINDKRIPCPHKEFDNESVRYRHRFAPFAPVQTPALVPYMRYKQVADMTAAQPSINLYVAAARSFHQAKQLLEAIPGSEKEVTDLLKVAKTNFIVLKLLASGHTKESATPPEFDFSIHMHFPVMKVK